MLEGKLSYQVSPHRLVLVLGYDDLGDVEHSDSTILFALFPTSPNKIPHCIAQYRVWALQQTGGRQAKDCYSHRSG